MLTTSFTCETPEQTFQLGEFIGHQAPAGEIWRLAGPLGAGKTVFAKGLAKGLGFEGLVTSPSFTLMHIYEGRFNLYHFDWFRLEKPAEVEDLGWREWTGRGGVVAVEWGDKFPQLFPDTTINLTFEILGEESRRLVLEANHPQTISRVEEIIRCWPP